MKKGFEIKGENIESFLWQKKESNLLAALSKSRDSTSLKVYDRKGFIHETKILQGIVNDWKWTSNGLKLGILSNSSSSGSQILIWAPGNAIVVMDLNVKYLELIEWSNDNEFIAITSSKGSMLIIQLASEQKIPIQGKHSKAITGIAWDSQNRVVCCSLDKTITISNTQGDTVHQTSLKGDPTLLAICRDGPVDRISVIINNKSILVFTEANLSNPIELSLSAKYGNIVHSSWHGFYTILLGFQSGYVVAISIAKESFGQETYQAKIFKSGLNDMSISLALGRCASCGDNEIKVQELSNLQDMSSTFSLEGGSAPVKVQFSDDGQYLSVLDKNNNLHSYIAKLSTKSSVWSTRVSYLKNFGEITVLNFSQNPPELATLSISLEPQCLAVGPSHGAYGQNEVVHFFHIAPHLVTKVDQLQYQYPTDKPESILTIPASYIEKRYSANVLDIQLNDSFALISIPGVILLQPLSEESLKGDNNFISFPDSLDNAAKISCAVLTYQFLYYATIDHKITIFDLNELQQVLEHNHTCLITKIIAQPDIGTKIIIVDEKNCAYVYNPINNSKIAVPGWSEHSLGALWQTNGEAGYSLFVTWTDTFISVYSFFQHSIKGPQCIPMNMNTKLPYGFKPLLFQGNAVVCQSLGGSLENVPLFSHKELSGEELIELYSDETDQARILRVMYLVGLKKHVWGLFPQVKSKKCWNLLAESLLELLHLKSAKKVFEMLENIPMTINLDRLLLIEDRNEIIGHVFVIFKDFNAAQQYFLNSSNPREAFCMRCDLLDWDQALSLAKTLAPNEMSVIYLEYAYQLEIDGKYGDAHSKYEKALAAVKELSMSSRKMGEHVHMIKSGLIRMIFALGDSTKALKLLNSVNDKKLILECIPIAEGLKQYVEAGNLYERIGEWEKAAESYIQVKNWNFLAPLLSKINSPKIFVQYGRAKEAEGNFADAAGAYEKAKDYDSVIRILIEHFNDIESAAELVRRTRARESAKLLATRYLQSQLFEQAIEFYLIAGLQEKAFDLAKRQNCVHYFAMAVKDEASVDILVDIANYFDGNGDKLEAGRYLHYAMKYPEALKMLLRCQSDPGSSIEMAIITVGEAKNDSLTHELIDFLMGEKDGIPKDAKYIFKLYMSLGQYREAARTAVIIAREEQVLGNYRVSHELLSDNYMHLKKTGASIPAELDRMLMLLHSYILVKALVRADEHLLGARMLMRVSSHISKFPAHVVPILTSTVIECYRSGLKSEAFDYAGMLMRPENRNKLDEKFKRKIEQIIRRPEKSEIEEPKTPCPSCNTNIPETELDCPECKSRIPYCIFTGRHMVLNDWSQCPKCHFPALLSQARSLIEKLSTCPMCNEEVFPQQFLLTSPEAATEIHKGEDEARTSFTESSNISTHGNSSMYSSTVGGLVTI